MKLIFISLCVFFSCVSYSQEKKDSTKIDSMDLKVISMRELQGYLDKINIEAQKQFNVADLKKYQEILKTIQSVYIEADRKRRK